MSEGTAQIQDKRSSKLTTKVASEVTDEGIREERAFAKRQQKPTAKKETNRDVLSSSSKDNLSSQSKKPKSMGYTDLKKRHDELVLEAQLFESRTKEMEKQHADTVNKLLQEIQQWKENTLNAEKEIASYKGLSEVKAENKRLVATLEAARVDAVTGKRLEESEIHQMAKYEAETQITLHEQKLDFVISELDKYVEVLEAQKIKLNQNSESKHSTFYKHFQR
ncbi:hypothetical protein EMCRGX_G032624 [Ephydatia muelleri]